MVTLALVHGGLTLSPLTSTARKIGHEAFLDEFLDEFPKLDQMPLSLHDSQGCPYVSVSGCSASECVQVGIYPLMRLVSQPPPCASALLEPPSESFCNA